MNEFPCTEHARINHQSRPWAQALMLFVASYKNCSQKATNHSARQPKPQPYWAPTTLAQSLLYPCRKRKGALIQQVTADDALAYRM
ncbi:hypothetical protein GV819_22945 [Pseudomonas sp. Fl5BN2]|uniref:hypothetical protein n=1 Tax=unclassified Pseudomonas TaxID=196821 RepID=UPI00137846FF|nr:MULTISPECIES: hypothetical protein [unclassified Pseudomonas]NBF05149.1 hypothetical protein [Pseudomonas sp. Fl5BN2]NBF08831.1 hypothetical protein [Pseudomonas sp. Fl4BN1]